MDRRKVALEVIRRIEDHPETFNQEYWFGHNPSIWLKTRKPRYYDDARIRTALKRDLSIENLNECGSVMCNAGHTVAVAVEMNKEFVEKSATESIGRTAERILSLTPLEAKYLFEASRTKEEVINAYQEIVDDKEITIPLNYLIKCFPGYNE